MRISASILSILPLVISILTGSICYSQNIPTISGGGNTASPISGTGIISDPITILDGAIPLTKISIAGATSGQAIIFNGIAWVPQSVTGSTDLGVTTRTSSNFLLESSTGGDATIPPATATLAGLLTAQNSVKLDDIPSGFQALTQHSITGTGTSAAPFQLVNDVASPLSNQYYGTDGIPTVGYHTLPVQGIGSNNGITTQVLPANQFELSLTGFGAATNGTTLQKVGGLPTWSSLQILPAGTVTGNTLRWDGTNWLSNVNIANNPTTDKVSIGNSGVYGTDSRLIVNGIIESFGTGVGNQPGSSALKLYNNNIGTPYFLSHGDNSALNIDNDNFRVAELSWERVYLATPLARKSTAITAVNAGSYVMDEYDQFLIIESSTTLNPTYALTLPDNPSTDTEYNIHWTCTVSGGNAMFLDVDIFTGIPAHTFEVIGTSSGELPSPKSGTTWTFKFKSNKWYLVRCSPTGI